MLLLFVESSAYSWTQGVCLLIVLKVVGFGTSFSIHKNYLAQPLSLAVKPNGYVRLGCSISLATFGIIVLFLNLLR